MSFAGVAAALLAREGAAVSQPLYGISMRLYCLLARPVHIAAELVAVEVGLPAALI